MKGAKVLKNNEEKLCRVLVSDEVNGVASSILEAAGIIVQPFDRKITPDALKDLIPGYAGIIVRSATKIPKSVLDGNHQLQVIGRAGIEPDGIAWVRATKSGIPVLIAPGNVVSVAEHTIALMLEYSRHISAAVASVKKLQWLRKPFMGHTLKGKTLAVIGLGRIGHELAKRASAFEMRIALTRPEVSSVQSCSLRSNLLQS